MLSQRVRDRCLTRQAAAKIETFELRRRQKTVDFVKALKGKALRSIDYFSEQRNSSIIEERLLRNIHDDVSMYWVARLKMDLRRLAQYADTLMRMGSGTLFLFRKES